MPQTRPTIVWFRRDLRIGDNSALAAAVRAGGPVIPLFVWSPGEEGDWRPGAASRWWLHRGLEALQKQFVSLGGSLVLRVGGSLEVLNGLIAETGAERVFWNRRYDSKGRETDARLKRVLIDGGIEARSFCSSLLIEPHTVGTGAGSPYKVYTPFWKSVRDRDIPVPDDPDRTAMHFPDRFPRGLGLEEFGLLPSKHWHEEMDRSWSAGEECASERLEAFLGSPALSYDEDRDRPDVSGTSSLSPYLSWGHIGPRQIVARLRDRCDLSAPGPLTFLKEVYWREFAYHVLYHFPDTPDVPLRSEFASFPWEPDDRILEAWRRGLTGYPIVDAGMRQLWRTGWMHNRVRMIVASLLVKHLLQDWKNGACWFWDTLIDADLASNTLGWQWSGGCGADAAPYFRVFNPIIQGRKFDPEGAYVRRYVPELAGMPAEHLHAPWEAPRTVLSAADVYLGESYPFPIVEHKAGRERALAAFESFKVANRSQTG